MGIRCGRSFSSISAMVAEPGVGLDEEAEALLRSIDPYPPAAVLHVLLDDPFFQPLTTLQKSASIR